MLLYWLEVEATAFGGGNGAGGSTLPSGKDLDLFSEIYYTHYGRSSYNFWFSKYLSDCVWEVSLFKRIDCAFQKK